ncbi:hypothetical protein FOA52_009110 [Chlamydomonas sp. UWO 241]|nr:hypothetical protein FOA52_009110 [Chlamydomonas sp. UWO 241]
MRATPIVEQQQQQKQRQKLRAQQEQQKQKQKQKQHRQKQQRQQQEQEVVSTPPAGKSARSRLQQQQEQDEEEPLTITRVTRVERELEDESEEPQAMAEGAGTPPVAKMPSACASLSLPACCAQRNVARLCNATTAADCLAATAGCLPGAFINEFHYDNVGTDTNEFVEVFLPAGADPSAYKLTLYNGGSTAAGKTYAPTNLSSQDLTWSAAYLIGEPSTDPRFVVLPTPGLQNGNNAQTTPDSIALTCGTCCVIEFISYEGTFTAIEGPASGLTSVDVGVSELNAARVGTPATLAGSSIQRTGAIPSSFDWSFSPTNTWATGANTPGTVNTGQTVTTVPLASVTPGTPTIQLYKFVGQPQIQQEL